MRRTAELEPSANQSVDQWIRPDQRPNRPRSSDRTEMCQTLSSILETETIPEELRPWVTEINPEFLHPLNPDSRIGPIFHPRDLARLMARLSSNGNLAFVADGGTVRTFMTGHEGLKDLDLAAVSLDPQNPIASVSELISRISGGKDPEEFRHPYFNPSRPIFGKIPASGSVGISIFIIKDGDGTPTSIKFFAQNGHTGRSSYDWLRVWEWTFADVGLISNRHNYNLYDWAWHQPIEDSAFILLKPTPDDHLPFKGWLFDFFGARKAIAQRGGELTYHPETILPEGEKNAGWVLSAASRITRGQKTAIYLTKDTPRSLFCSAAGEIRRVANGIEIKESDFPQINLYLEQLYRNLDHLMRFDAFGLRRVIAAMRENRYSKDQQEKILLEKGLYPTPTIRFLTGEVAQRLFPQLAEFLDFPVPYEEKTVQDLVGAGKPQATTRTVRDLLWDPEEAITYCYPDAYRRLIKILQDYFYSSMTQRLIAHDAFWRNRLAQDHKRLKYNQLSTTRGSDRYSLYAADWARLLQDPEIIKFIGADQLSITARAGLAEAIVVDLWEKLFIPFPADHCPVYRGIGLMPPLERVVDLPVGEALDRFHLDPHASNTVGAPTPEKTPDLGCPYLRYHLRGAASGNCPHCEIPWTEGRKTLNRLMGQDE